MHGNQWGMHLKGYAPLLQPLNVNIRASNSIFIKYTLFLSQLFE